MPRTNSAAKKKTPSAGTPGKNQKKIYLDCPYIEKDQVKALGAQWDYPQKKWYVPPSGYESIGQFNPWFPFQAYLDCPFEEKDQAKRAGAKWDGVVKKWYYRYQNDQERMSKTVPPALHQWLTHPPSLSTKPIKQEEAEPPIKQEENELPIKQEEAEPPKETNTMTTSSPQKKTAQKTNITPTPAKRKPRDPPATPPASAARGEAPSAKTSLVNKTNKPSAASATPPVSTPASASAARGKATSLSAAKSSIKKTNKPSAAPATPSGGSAKAQPGSSIAKSPKKTKQTKLTDPAMTTPKSNKRKDPPHYSVTTTPNGSSLVATAHQVDATGDPRISDQLSVQQLQQECEYRGIEDYTGKSKEWLLKELIEGTLWLSATSTTTTNAQVKPKKLKLDSPQTSASMNVPGNGKLLSIEFSGMPRISSALTIAQLTHEVIHRRKHNTNNTAVPVSNGATTTPSKAGVGLSSKPKAWFLETLGVGSIWITGAALVNDDNPQQAEVLNQWPRISESGLTKSNLIHEIMARANYSKEIVSKGLSSKAKNDLLKILGIGSIWETAANQS